MDLTTIVSIIIYIAGFLTGGAVASCILYRTIDGVLKIDNSNFEKDIYRIERKDLDVLPYKKHIILKVDNAADLSQE